jgi:hypothetical protein
MRPKLLQSVAVTRAIPEFRLRLGDTGVVVEVFEPEGLMVEFMDDAGDTVAILDLTDADVKTLSASELKNLQHAQPLPPGTEPPIADATTAVRH